MEQTKVFLVDDHQESRKVVRDFLNTYANVSVVGEAADGSEVMKKIHALLPDIVLMDIAMPQRNGIEVTRFIKQRFPAMKVIIVTMYDNPMYRIQAEEVKADGFILKSSFKCGLELIFGPRSERTKSTLSLKKKDIYNTPVSA